MMFSLLSVSLFVCLSDCQRDYSKICGPIFMKLGGWMRTNRLDFGMDLDPGSVFHFSNMER